MPREIDRAEAAAHIAAGAALLAARLLEGRGYRNVLRFNAGIADWVAAGLPVETDAA